MIIATESTFERTVYWTPEPESNTELAKQDVPHLLREHLVDAVTRRLDSSTKTVSQLSGGLDSASIAASANILTDPGTAHETFATVSAVFPGSLSDESELINDVATSQPFAHESFAVTSASLTDYGTVMAEIDGPRVSPTHPLETVTGTFSRSIDADLVLTGLGGDYVLDDSQLVVDLLKSRSLTTWWSLARETSRSRDAPILSVVVPSLLSATPERAKVILRRFGSDSRSDSGNLMSGGLMSLERATETEQSNDLTSYVSRTQATIITGVRSSLVSQINEYVETRMARHGLGVSHPYLDRDLIEFVASIPLDARPADGRSKSLVRHAFEGFLPESVLAKPRKTKADDYILSEFTAVGRAFEDRYPSVPAAAEQFVDSGRYTFAVQRFDATEATLEIFNRLWPAWTLFLWLDSLAGR